MKTIFALTGITAAGYTLYNHIVHRFNNTEDKPDREI